MLSPSDRYVVLRGGLAVPLEPVRLVLDLEARGFTIQTDGEDLFIRPKGHLTDDDRLALRRWKSHILALVAYQAPEVN